MSLTVVLVDDHAVVRTALRMLLDRAGDIQVVGEAPDGEAGLRLIAAAQPDVAVVDVALPNVSGFSLAEEIDRRDLPTRVLFLTAYNSAAYLVRALEVGALGYLPKSVSEDELLTAIRQVATGRSYVPPSLAATLVTAFRDTGRPTAPSPLIALTPRERQVLDLVASGRTTEQIGALLGISPHTVHRHRSAVMRKLGFHDRVELVRFAVANDLVGPAGAGPASVPSGNGEPRSDL